MYYLYFFPSASVRRGTTCVLHLGPCGYHASAVPPACWGDRRGRKSAISNGISTSLLRRQSFFEYFHRESTIYIRRSIYHHRRRCHEAVCRRADQGIIQEVVGIGWEIKKKNWERRLSAFGVADWRFFERVVSWTSAAMINRQTSGVALIDRITARQFDPTKTNWA
jgi:hypothetical protein